METLRDSCIAFIYAQMQTYNPKVFLFTLLQDNLNEEST